MTKQSHPAEIALSSVKSSQIDAVGHRGTTLRVRFKNGGTYEYQNVSPDEFAKLQAAESLGAHLAKHIKGAKKFSRLPDASTQKPGASR